MADTKNITDELNPLSPFDDPAGALELADSVLAFLAIASENLPDGALTSNAAVGQGLITEWVRRTVASAGGAIAQRSLE